MAESTIGTRLRKRRLRSGMSQEAIAAALKVSSRTVSRWEKGEPIPIVKRHALAEIFNEAPEVFDAQEYVPMSDEAPQWFRDAMERNLSALNEINAKLDQLVFRG